VLSGDNASVPPVGYDRCHMIDQARLDAIRLKNPPVGQMVVGSLMLAPNYNLPGKRTKIRLEGTANLPKGGAILVMNHTDRYNYWPLQYQMWRERLGYTATWVKGKYFENRALGWFMDTCNNIPLPSRGYVLTKDFQSAMQRAPKDEEYRALKQLTDGEIDEAEARARGGKGVAAMLDRPAFAGYAASFERRFDAMMKRVVEICREGLDIGLFLLVFPQGTRSRRLTHGHTGAAQIALHTRVPVIPIGCNGSDRCYPKNSPLSRGGTITYRIGAPLRIDTERHAKCFRGATDLMMARVNDLLDEEYRYAPEADADAATGASRFV
jgi:1-acyl-sn-glycerol-3-phosphate acyltransferase